MNLFIDSQKIERRWKKFIFKKKIDELEVDEKGKLSDTRVILDKWQFSSFLNSFPPGMIHFQITCLLLWVNRK